MNRETPKKKGFMADDRRNIKDRFQRERLATGLPSGFSSRPIILPAVKLVM